MGKLGGIADDFTGATDIAGFLVANGVSAIQTNESPPLISAEKRRPLSSVLNPGPAPKRKLSGIHWRALAWLKDQGCSQFYFKYCSTFDSTADGNIGPVTDALMKALDTNLTIVCPALPVNGRTLYNGYLFVHDQLLHESGMRNHRLHP